MTIKRTAAAAAVLFSSLAWVVPGSAQQDERAVRPDLSTEVAQAPECEAPPVAVVTRFLGLGPEQVHAFGQLLEARQATVGPILHEIALREQRIRELVAAGGNPAEIGTLVLQIHQLRQVAEVAQAQFLAGFAGMLNEEQRRTWEQVRLAARLQPVLPAFQALQVL
jgi:hypothetical protein